MDPVNDFIPFAIVRKKLQRIPLAEVDKYLDLLYEQGLWAGDDWTHPVDTLAELIVLYPERVGSLRSLFPGPREELMEPAEIVSVGGPPSPSSLSYAAMRSLLGYPPKNKTVGARQLRLSRPPPSPPRGPEPLGTPQPLPNLRDLVYLPSIDSILRQYTDRQLLDLGLYVPYRNRHQLISRLSRAIQGPGFFIPRGTDCLAYGNALVYSCLSPDEARRMIETPRPWGSGGKSEDNIRVLKELASELGYVPPDIPEARGY